MLLAGDIGGTKTNLAIFTREAGPRAPTAEGTFPSGDYPSLAALVQKFLAGHGVPIERASFGVAGPVVAGQARITNLPWVMEEHELASILQIEHVRLLNDLESIAHAVPFLQPDDLQTLSAGQAVAGGTLAVIAPGTGLGEAFLVWDGTRYRSQPSEGGHTDFAPANGLEIELLRYLQAQKEHVSYERVCSGLGLPNIYAFLRDSGYAAEPEWLAEELAAAADPTPIIVNAALGGSSEHGEALASDLCIATLNMFISILGAEAGNLALKVLATGGVYIGGGIPPRIIHALSQERFLIAFRSKGRFEELLRTIPIHVILNPKIALLGAGYHGLEE